MRISDWSSDVCSSELDILLQRGRVRARIGRLDGERGRGDSGILLDWQRLERQHAAKDDAKRDDPGEDRPGDEEAGTHVQDRKSVGSGRSVSVRVNLGVGRIINKNITTIKNDTY